MAPGRCAAGALARVVLAGVLLAAALCRISLASLGFLVLFGVFLWAEPPWNAAPAIGTRTAVHVVGSAYAWGVLITRDVMTHLRSGSVTAGFDMAAAVACTSALIACCTTKSTEGRRGRTHGGALTAMLPWVSTFLMLVVATTRPSLPAVVYVAVASEFIFSAAEHGRKGDTHAQWIVWFSAAHITAVYAMYAAPAPGSLPWPELLGVGAEKLNNESVLGLDALGLASLGSEMALFVTAMWTVSAHSDDMRTVQSPERLQLQPLLDDPPARFFKNYYFGPRIDEWFLHLDRVAVAIWTCIWILYTVMAPPGVLSLVILTTSMLVFVSGTSSTSTWRLIGALARVAALGAVVSGVPGLALPSAFSPHTHMGALSEAIRAVFGAGSPQNAILWSFSLLASSACVLWGNRTRGLMSATSAARAGRADILRLKLRVVVDGGGLIAGSDDHSLLHAAAARGRVGATMVLLGIIQNNERFLPGGIDVVNKFGDTPLHMASRGGHTGVSDALIAAGADVAKVNVAGVRADSETSPYWVRFSRHVETFLACILRWCVSQWPRMGLVWLYFTATTSDSAAAPGYLAFFVLGAPVCSRRLGPEKLNYFFAWLWWAVLAYTGVVMFWTYFSGVLHTTRQRRVPSSYILNAIVCVLELRLRNIKINNSGFGAERAWAAVAAAALLVASVWSGASLLGMGFLALFVAFCVGILWPRRGAPTGAMWIIASSFSAIALTVSYSVSSRGASGRLLHPWISSSTARLLGLAKQEKITGEPLLIRLLPLAIAYVAATAAASSRGSVASPYQPPASGPTRGIGSYSGFFIALSCGAASLLWPAPAEKINIFLRLPYLAFGLFGFACGPLTWLRPALASFAIVALMLTYSLDLVRQALKGKQIIFRPGEAPADAWGLVGAIGTHVIVLSSCVATAAMQQRRGYRHPDAAATPSLHDTPGPSSSLLGRGKPKNYGSSGSTVVVRRSSPASASSYQSDDKFEIEGKIDTKDGGDDEKNEIVNEENKMSAPTSGSTLRVFQCLLTPQAQTRALLSLSMAAQLLVVIWRPQCERIIFIFSVFLFLFYRRLSMPDPLRARSLRPHNHSPWCSAGHATAAHLRACRRMHLLPCLWRE